MADAASERSHSSRTSADDEPQPLRAKFFSFGPASVIKHRNSISSAFTSGDKHRERKEYHKGSGSIDRFSITSSDRLSRVGSIDSTATGPFPSPSARRRSATPPPSPVTSTRSAQSPVRSTWSIMSNQSPTSSPTTSQSVNLTPWEPPTPNTGNARTTMAGKLSPITMPVSGGRQRADGELFSPRTVSSASHPSLVTVATRDASMPSPVVLPGPVPAENDRFVSVADLETSATTIDDEYSLKLSTFRIVTSDGVLFCVPEKVMRHSDFFWDLRDEAVHNEILLADAEYETARLFKLFLWAMQGQSSELSMQNCTHGNLIDATRLAQRLGGSMVVTNLLFAIGVHLDKGCPSCRVGLVFTLAAQLDNIGLAARAAAKLCEKPRLTGVAEEDFDECPPRYLFKLLRSVWLTVPIEEKDPSAIHRAFCK